ncbi:MAG TPA: hypothetical protein VE127_17070 [Solirubrobacteraceae bacterium]|nr:hypothetical protein [Solirubrobacteraceae bacterium]
MAQFQTANGQRSVGQTGHDSPANTLFLDALDPLRASAFRGSVFPDNVTSGVTKAAFVEARIAPGSHIVQS